MSQPLIPFRPLISIKSDQDLEAYVQERIADAQSAAAAPDLHAALQDIVSECDGRERPYSSDSYLPLHLLDAARDALHIVLPALPVNEAHHVTGYVVDQHMGLSLRDYFAAKAMQAQVTTDMVPGEACDALLAAAADAGQDPVYRLALLSYEIADAMLKARQS